MRVLQVLWDGGGNVPPQLLIARKLIERGHDVRVLGHRCQRERVEATGAEFGSFERAPDADASRPETDLIRDWEARTPIGAFARVRDNLIYGPALLFAKDVIAELERRPVDVVSFDFMVLGAGLGAERAGVPAAALIHTIYPLPAPGVPPFGSGLPPARGLLDRLWQLVLARAFERAFSPGIRALNGARRTLGLASLGSPWGQLERTDAVLVLTSPEFDFAGRADLPPNVRYTGPVIDHGPAAGWGSPWAPDDSRPLVLASFSTTFQDQRHLAGRVLSALGDLPVRGLLTTGPAVDVAGLPVPDNVEVRDYVPHAAVLPEASLVVTHGGLGTVHAALAHGVPLVCVPHGRDQDDNAARVVAASAGVRLRRRAAPKELRAAAGAALEDSRLRDGARRMAEAFTRDDGATRVAEELEALAGG